MATGAGLEQKLEEVVAFPPDGHGHAMDHETFEHIRGMFHEDVMSAANDVGADGKDQGVAAGLSLRANYGTR